MAQGYASHGISPHTAIVWAAMLKNPCHFFGYMLKGADWNRYIRKKSRNPTHNLSSLMCFFTEPIISQTL
jgi:hypothetical protein